jgi:hypothetical protein
VRPSFPRFVDGDKQALEDFCVGGTAYKKKV